MAPLCCWGKMRRYSRTCRESCWVTTGGILGSGSAQRSGGAPWAALRHQAAVTLLCLALAVRLRCPAMERRRGCRSHLCGVAALGSRLSLVIAGTAFLL